MKIKYIKNGECKTVNDSYGARLIEQGKAVYAGDAAKPKPVKKDTAGKPTGDA